MKDEVEVFKLKEIKIGGKNSARIILRINASLDFDVLYSVFEDSMAKFLEKNNIGEIIKDRVTLVNHEKYVTNIVFEAYHIKLDLFMRMLTFYRFPKGSYLKVNQRKIELGDLEGVSILFNEIDNDKLERICSELSQEIFGKYLYKSSILFRRSPIITYYTDSIEKLKIAIYQYIEKNQYNKILTVVDYSSIKS